MLVPPPPSGGAAALAGFQMIAAFQVSHTLSVSILLHSIHVYALYGSCCLQGKPQSQDRANGCLVNAQ